MFAVPEEVLLIAQEVPSEEVRMVPLSPTAMKVLFPKVTSERLSVVPEALEVRVLPSDEVKMFLEVPTVTNVLFPYLNAQNCLKKNSQQIN